MKTKYPKTWMQVRLSEINNYKSMSLTPANFGEEIFELYSVPSFPFDAPETVKGKEVGSSKQVVESKDILICKINPRINRVWQVKTSGRLRKIASSEWIVVRAPEFNSNYLQFYFSSPSFRELMVQNVTGVGGSLTRAQPKRVANFPVPIAPFNEQKRISKKLDVLINQVNSCKSRLELVPQILKSFYESVLVAATSGHLTEDWRNERGIEFDWQKVRLSDVGSLGRGKSKHRPRNDKRLFGGDYPFIQTGDIAQSNGWINSHTQTYSEFGLNQSKLWPTNTVCITIAANIANTAILSYPACFPDSVVGFIPDPEKSLPQFVKWSIDVIKNDLESIAPATAQKNINLRILEDVQFDCPSLQEQVEIVRRVEKLFAYAESIKTHYQSVTRQVDQLTPALLAKAFRGELVKQNPTDESASELFERIKLERKNMPKETRKTLRNVSKEVVKTENEFVRLGIVEALKTSKELSTQQLFQLAGYPLDADADLVEEFFVELRNALTNNQIQKRRQNEIDWFSLINNKGN